MVVQFSIPVANAAALIGLGFSRIEVWHSQDQGNSFQEVTASSPASAVLAAAIPQTQYQMGGHQLRFAIDGGSEQIVNFSSVVPYWTATQVVTAINAVMAGVASVNSDGAVALTSPTTGRASEVEVTYSDAPDLGWADGSIALGLDARLVLVNNVLSYPYTDLGGSTTDLYKWRFSADGVNPISDFGSVIQGTTPPIVPTMSVATAQFYGLDGQPQQRTLIIVSDNPNQSLAGALIGNQDPIEVTADSSGFLQIALVRGSVIRVAIEGTAFVREITVPDTDSFDLLSALSAASDPYTIQVPPPFLTRRTV